MISVKDAQYLTTNSQLNSFARQEKISFDQSFGKILATDLIADRDYPPFNRSMMDGICINFKDLSDGIREFEIKAVIAAGEPCEHNIDSAQCFEIMTGAMVPSCCDVVIPYEHLNKNHNTFSITMPLDRYKQFENIHLQGSDIKSAETILNKNAVLTPTHLAIAASVGADFIDVYRGPKIAVVSTGNELVDINQKPEHYQIRRSNSYAIKAALKQFGFLDIDLFHLNDNYQQSRQFVSHSLENYDYLFFSGGVSKGKFDYLPLVFEELGVDKIFHGVAQRPGKPLWFGIHRESDTNVIGLPGNPISSLVCLYRYFLPVKAYEVELVENIDFKNSLTYFLPVTLKDSKAYPNKVKNSGEFSGLAYTDGFIELPAEKDCFFKGEKYLFYSWMER